MITDGGADRAGVHRGQDADRAGAGDEHDVATGDAGPVDAVRGDGRRLDDGALEVGDLVRELGDLVLLDHGELGQPTGLGAEAGAGELHAEVSLTAPAVAAAPADDGRHDRDPVADRDVAHVGADLDDARRELVARASAAASTPVSGCGVVGVTIGPTAYSCRSVPQMPQ